MASTASSLQGWWSDVSLLLSLSKSADWRKLEKSEIDRLRDQGNKSLDWDALRVSEDFQPEGYRNCKLSGSCFLSKTHRDGVQDVSLCDVVVDEGVSIHHTRKIGSTIIGKNCRIVGCGSIEGGKDHPWSTHLNIALGSEMGERAVWIHPFLSLEELTSKVKGGKSLVNSKDHPAEGDIPARVFQSVLMPNCDIEGLARAEGFCLGESTKVRDAGLLSNVISLSSLQEEVFLGYGVILRDVQLHWGASVTDRAQLENVVVGEMTRLGYKLMIEQTYIGPDNQLGKGEVACSLLGPLVGLHHQSLLIGVLWPEGRGNVGYGANVGSNHTGKKPDQECFPGEGCFLGLDVTVKFPSNFERSPYSLLATGLKALPQKVEFPFSLLLPGDFSTAEGGRGLNEIRPGWVYLHNGYLLHRNELKFQKRKRSKRFICDTRPLRPDWIPLVSEGLGRLESLQGKEIYTEKDCPGLGKNYLTQRALDEGIQSYGMLLLHLVRLAVLEGLNVNVNVKKKAEELGFDHSQKGIREGLKGDLEKLLSSGKEALGRDEKRGREIMPGYQDGHTDIEEDSVLVDLSARIKDLSQA